MRSRRSHPPAKDDHVVRVAYALVRERYFTTAVELDDIRRTVASKGHLLMMMVVNRRVESGMRGAQEYGYGGVDIVLIDDR